MKTEIKSIIMVKVNCQNVLQYNRLARVLILLFACVISLSSCSKEEEIITRWRN